MWGSPSGLPPGFCPALRGRRERLQSTKNRLNLSAPPRIAAFAPVGQIQNAAAIRQV